LLLYTFQLFRTKISHELAQSQVHIALSEFTPISLICRVNKAHASRLKRVLFCSIEQLSLAC